MSWLQTVEILFFYFFLVLLVFSFLVLVLVLVSEQLWLFNGQVEDSTVCFFISLTVQSMGLHHPWPLVMRIGFFSRSKNRTLGFEHETSDSAVRHSTNSMIMILKNNSESKMQLEMRWWGSSRLHLWREKSNCSSHIVTQFMDVLFGVIQTRSLFKNLLLMPPDTPARVWHLRWTQQTISMWSSANLLTA